MMDRPMSRDPGQTAGPSTIDHNVFADDFVVNTPAMSEYEFGMADGFRPGNFDVDSQLGSGSRLSNGSAYRPQSIIQSMRRQPSTTSVARPSSIAKNPATRHSFTLANDGSRAPVTGRQSGAFEGAAEATIPYRRRSGQTGFLTPTTSFNAPSGSSHVTEPDALDMESPQATRPRSALDSTPRPAHPYGLYQQNIEPESIEEVTPETAPPIQVGFVGRNANYRRQRGPDGEEQDIIGPDGHVEQLPPYTEEPDELEKTYAARSRPLPAAPSPIPTAESSRSQESLTESDDERSHIATIAPMPVPSPAQIESPPPASVYSEKGKAWKEKSWKEKRRTKVLCGVIPLWWLFIAAGCISFTGLVVGGVLAGVLHSKEAEDDTSTNSTSTQAPQIFDALPIPTPANLGPIPTGAFKLPLGQPEETQTECITSPAYSKAWSCNVPEPIPMVLEMNLPPGGYYIAKVYSPPPPGQPKPWNWGPQAPVVMPPQKLIFATDIVEPQRGPALWFTTFYEKIVVLPGDTFNAPATKQKRHSHDQFPPPPPPPLPPYPPPPFPPPPPRTDRDRPSLDNQPKNGTGMQPSGPPSALPDQDLQPKFHRKGIANPGDESWFCHWRDTVIEGFIYVTQPLSEIGSALTTSLPSPIATTRSLQTSASSSTTQRQSTTFSSSTTSQTTPTSATTTSALQRRLASPSPIANPERHDRQTAQPTTTYPYAIKLIERRQPKDKDNKDNKPFCQKMAIAQDNSVQPLLDDDGNILRIDIAEVDPSSEDLRAAATSAAASASASMSMSAAASATGQATPRSRVRRGLSADEIFGPREVVRELGKRANPRNSCGCRWLSTGQ